MKRTRCVKCDQLTHSGWYLYYLEDKKPMSGRHCFTCSRKVRVRLAREELKVEIR